MPIGMIGLIQTLIFLTSLHWAAFWSLSIPSTIMLTFPRVCTIQFIPVVAAVVGCWGVGATSHPDFTVSRGNKLAAVNWRKFNYLTSSKLYELVTYFSSLDGILELFRTNYHHADTSSSVNHPIRIHSHRCNRQLKNRSGLSRRPCHIVVL